MRSAKIRSARRAIVGVAVLWVQAVIAAPIGPTTTSITSDQNPSVYGQLITVQATVTPLLGGGTPTGTVVFMDGASTMGVTGLDGLGNASVTVGNLDAGSHILTAQYNGDGVNVGSTSDPLSQTVDQATTVTGVGATPSPVLANTDVMLLASVAAAPPAAGIPTGTVSFFDNGNFITNAPLDGSGNASFVTQFGTTGNHAITAAYNGDVNFQSSSSGTDDLEIDPPGTDISITSDINPSVFGQSVTFTVGVTPQSGTITPFGNVTLTDNGNFLASGPLVLGPQQFSTSSLTPGNHDIAVFYAGDGFYESETSAPYVQAVDFAQTQVLISTSQNPTVFGQFVTITATVSALAPSSGVPTGDVVFFDDTLTLGQVTLDGLGTGSFGTIFVADTHTLTVQYLGNAEFTESLGGPYLEEVLPANTTTSLTVDLNPAPAGATITFQVAVATVAPGGGFPTGSATLLEDGTTTLGVVQLDLTGMGSFTTSSLTPGDHHITARYEASPDHNSSNSAELIEAIASVSEGEGEGNAEGEGEGEGEGSSEGEGEGEGSAEGEGEGEGEGAAEGEGEGALEGEAGNLFYGPDRNMDHMISLSELLRVIQFFNSAGYHCQTGSEDGFDPGPGDENCTPYATDYNPQDWMINLSELLRAIQFYNSNGYHYCPADNTEDNFCPGL